MKLALVSLYIATMSKLYNSHLSYPSISANNVPPTAWISRVSRPAGKVGDGIAICESCGVHLPV